MRKRSDEYVAVGIPIPQDSPMWGQALQPGTRMFLAATDLPDGGADGIVIGTSPSSEPGMVVIEMYVSTEYATKLAAWIDARR